MTPWSKKTRQRECSRRSLEPPISTSESRLSSLQRIAKVCPVNTQIHVYCDGRPDQTLMSTGRRQPVRDGGNRWTCRMFLLQAVWLVSCFKQSAQVDDGTFFATSALADVGKSLENFQCPGIG